MDSNIFFKYEFSSALKTIIHFEEMLTVKRKRSEISIVPCTIFGCFKIQKSISKSDQSGDDRVRSIAP